MGDFILSRDFGFATQRAGGDNARLQAVPPAGFTHAVVWVNNDFPYNLEAGIEHHLLWSAGGALSDEQVAQTVAAQRPSSDWETLIFVNPVRLQSVTNVWHAHCLSRPRAGAA